MTISWKTIMKKRDKGYFIEVDVQFTEKFHELFNGLPFLLERMKIKNVKKVVAKNSICYNRKCKARTKSWSNFEKKFIE